MHLKKNHIIIIIFISCWILFIHYLVETKNFNADIDNNGRLEQHDFECMALKMTLIEGKGGFNYGLYQENLHIMLSLWDEIAEIADFNKVLYEKM